MARSPKRERHGEREVKDRAAPHRTAECPYYTERKTHLSTPPHPHKKRSGAVKRRETAPLRRLPRACPYYTTTGRDLSTPPTRLFPRGSLNVRSERRGAVECLRRDDATVDLVVGSHCRFVSDENGHAPHAVLFLGVYRPRVETVPQSASCAATDCPAYGVGGYARATRDFIEDSGRRLSSLGDTGREMPTITSFLTNYGLRGII